MAFQRGPSTASKAIPALMSPNYECRNHLNVYLYLKVYENLYIKQVYCKLFLLMFHSTLSLEIGRRIAGRDSINPSTDSKTFKVSFTESLSNISSPTSI